MPSQPIQRAEVERPTSIIQYGFLWQALRKYWATSIGVLLSVGMGVTFYTLGQTKIYESTSTLQFDPNPPRPLGKDVDTVVDMGVGNYWNNREYYESQYKIIQSMRVALAVVHELQLANDAGFIRNMGPGTVPRPVHVSEEEAAETLRDRLHVEPVKESRLAVVKFEDADPQRAQRILSVLTDIYIAQNLDDALASSNAASDWLRGQLDKLKVDLESSEMALHDYKMNKNILSVAFDDQSNMLREEMKQINEALTHVRTKREEVAARVAELQRVAADDPTGLPSTELLGSTLLQELRQRYSDAVRERQGLIGSGKGPNHPDVSAADNRIEATRSALLSEVKNIQGALSRDLSVVQRQESGLSNLFEKANSQALDLNLLEIEYKRLQRSKDNTEKLYSLVLERTKESDLTRMLRVNNLRVVDRALMPQLPIRPRVPLNVALGVIVGTLLGLLAALGRGTLDRTIKTPQDIEDELGVTSLGLLPIVSSERKPSRRRRGRVDASGAPELIVHDQPMSGTAEAARAIRTNLLFMSPDNPHRLLLVTSASPAEGKTTVACCLAVAMAQTAPRVLLIDCDLRRPRIHRIFGKTSEVGLTTSVMGDGEDDAVLPTEVGNLWIVPAGPLPPNPAEILHSERFKRFLERMRGRFDRVIIDSPPVVAVTDAAILSTLVDATVLVVRAFATRKDVARHAARAITDVGSRIAGTVLNAVDLNRHEYRYSYYYYNHRGYYGPAADRRPSEESPAP